MPGSVDLGPKCLLTTLMVVQISGICQVGVCLNRGLRRFSQMGYDAPRPLSRVLGSRLRGNDEGVRGNDGGFAGMTVGVLSEPRITEIFADGL